MSLLSTLKLCFVYWSSPSLYASLVLLLTNLFFWNGMDLLTPFLFPFVAMASHFLFACVFSGALVKACMVKAESLRGRFRFVFLDLIVAMIAIFFPFTEFVFSCDFNLNFNQPMEVVKLAREGKLRHPKGRYDDVYSLPWLNIYQKAEAKSSYLVPALRVHHSRCQNDTFRIAVSG